MGEQSFKWIESDGYESDAELKRYVEEHYDLVDQLQLIEAQRGVKFFARRVSNARQQ